MSLLAGFWSPYKKLSDAEKKNFWILTIVHSLSLFTYPILRSCTDSFLLQNLGAKNWPLANLFAVISLVFVVNLYNRYIKEKGSKRLFLWTSFFSAIFFFISALMFNSLPKEFGYLMFVWKEAYIVLMVHMCLGLFNSNFSFEFAKTFHGPYSALVSLGSISGGIITASFVKSIGIQLLMGVAITVLALVPLLIIKLQDNSQAEIKKQPKPLKSLEGILPYVGGILSLVALSQFCIYIINFRFNIEVADTFTSAVDKTAFFGKIYAIINIVSLFMSAILTPLMLKKFSSKWNHIIVAGSYGFAIFPILIFGGGAMVGVISSLFVYAKGMDYSHFGTIKELLYYPLEKAQRIGAKYIVDMFGYRFSKGLVALVLSFFQNIQVINILL